MVNTGGKSFSIKAKCQRLCLIIVIVTVDFITYNFLDSILKVNFALKKLRNLIASELSGAS